MGSIEGGFNIRIPDHISSLKSYQPGKTIPQLKEEYGWEKVSILWNNENTLGYSPKSRQAVIDAYEGINYYPDPLSIQLREKLATKHKKSIDQIILGNGAESVLMLAIRAICSGDDEFLTSEGGFMIIYNWARINNVRCVATPMTEPYGFDLDAIKNRINRDTKIIYLANANNPTGTMLTKSALEEFIQQVPDHILIIIDEAYFEFSDALTKDFPDTTQWNYPNVLSLRTFSKAYGIAGARIGYGVAHPKIIESMMKAKLTFEPTTLAQAAGLGALEDVDFLQKTIENNNKGIHYFYTEFDRLGVIYIPSFANFVMTVWNSKEEVNGIFNALMKEGVLVRPLLPPIDHCIRVSVGRPDENEHFIKTLEKILH